MATKDKKVKKEKDKKRKRLRLVKQQAEKILELLGVAGEIEVFEDKENEAIGVQIESPEPGVIIGRHGETISSLQLLSITL